MKWEVLGALVCLGSQLEAARSLIHGKGVISVQFSLAKLRWFYLIPAVYHEYDQLGLLKQCQDAVVSLKQA